MSKPTRSHIKRWEPTREFPRQLSAGAILRLEKEEGILEQLKNGERYSD